MKLRRIQALAFGPLADQSLELCGRMNVVYGPNEAGKSSWHAAMYAGICGRRRGARTKEETEFADRHQPWDGDGWAVVALIELADGRRVELHQVLDDPAASRAVDPDTNRDVTQQFFSDGAPDASRELGLSRDTMLATATVRQAEISRVQQDASALQAQLQAATSKAGADGTAEAAIRRIEGYKSEYVGLRRANSKRPLQAAINRLETAEAELAAARADHQRYLELVAEREEAEATFREHDRRLRSARHVARARELAAARERLERARELAARLPEGEPPDVDALEAEEDRIREVLTRYDDRPDEPEVPEGRSVEELERALAELPERPRGDVEIAPEVERRYEAWRSARADLNAHERYRPEAVADPYEPPEGVEPPDAAELRRLAELLATPEPESDEELSRRLDELYGRLRPGVVTLLGRIAGPALVVAAVVFLLQGRELVWWLVPAVLGLLTSVFAFLPASDRHETQREIRALEVQQGIAEEQMRSYFERRQEARRRLNELGLPLEVVELRRLADRIERSAGGSEELARWEARREILADELRARAEALAEALASRLGVEAIDHDADPEEAGPPALEAVFSHYESECRERRRRAERAAQRDDLEQSLETRRALEERVEEARTRRAAAERAVLGLAQDLGLEAEAPGEGPGEGPGEERGEEPGGEPGGEERRTDGVVEALRQRAAAIASELPEWRRAEIARGKLEEILGEGELADLEAEVEALAGAVAEERGDFVAVELGADPEATLEALERRRQEARRRLDHLSGQITDREKSLPSVPEAEENLELARDELARVERLEQTLDSTRDFLDAARDRVQRDIAPHLRQALQADLAAVTGGRYSEARVDPANLEVSVKDPDGVWRSAALLSHGTTEQIYLLLRLALVRHMCAVGEPSPVFLDDPTVQCDAERTVAILEVLESLSTEHQIILFSQEEEVRRWAAAHHDGETVRLIELAER